jgi:hypothetical protein
MGLMIVMKKRKKKERKRRENKKNPDREGEIEKEKRVLAMKIKGYLS